MKVFSTSRCTGSLNIRLCTQSSKSHDGTSRGFGSQCVTEICAPPPGVDREIRSTWVKALRVTES